MFVQYGRIPSIFNWATVENATDCLALKDDYVMCNIVSGSCICNVKRKYDICSKLST